MIYIVHELNPSCNSKFKHFLFGATSVSKIIDKGKFVYSGYRITFDSVNFWSSNDTGTNIVIFGVDNSSLFHADNRKNNVLVLGEGPTFGINRTFGSPEKTFSINFSKENAKLCLSLHYNADNSCLLVNGKEIFSLKPTIKMLTFNSILSRKYI